MNDIDASGEEVLSLVVGTVRSAGLDISFCGVNETVMAVLERTHLIEKIGRDHMMWHDKNGHFLKSGLDPDEEVFNDKKEKEIHRGI